MSSDRSTTLRPGEKVLVDRADGSVAGFVVTRVESFDKDSFPSKQVYGNIDHGGLRLITCDGLDEASGSFADNLVVFADLAFVRG